MEDYKFIYVFIIILILGICFIGTDEDKPCFIPSTTKKDINRTCTGDNSPQCKRCKRFIEDE